MPYPSSCIELYGFGARCGFCGTAKDAIGSAVAGAPTKRGTATGPGTDGIGVAIAAAGAPSATAAATVATTNLAVTHWLHVVD